MVKKVRLIYSIVLFTLFFSCSNDPIVYTLTATADPAEGGQVVPEYMEYGEGDTAYVVATPSDEYVLESWSGDASGNANTLVITMDKNKDVTAHFVKKKYPLTIKIEGEGEVKQEVIKQGMASDYNSGTIVKLTAHPDDEWLFVRWRGDLTGSENPTQITIDGPKTVVAEFEKKKYPLTIEIVGEGQVAEKVIKPGAPNDYNSGTIVELEALSGQSWEFSEWQVDLTGTQNPKQITINSPKTVRAVFVTAQPFYLDNNGVTIKARDWVTAGTTGDLDGVTYTAVDNQTLQSMAIDGQDLSKVVTTLVTNMSSLAAISNGKLCNYNITRWDVSNVTSMRNMLRGCANFNQDIGSWDVSKVIDMEDMFHLALNFNQDIGNWNVSNVTNMKRMFYHAYKFNQDISSWNVSNLTKMEGMFIYATSFNQDIGSWDVSKVTDMTTIFTNAQSFNQDISSWNVSNVTEMEGMFSGARSFNQDIGGWDVAKVTSMWGMFNQAQSFNQDISSWDVSNVTTMQEMFQGAEVFNQDISIWDVSNVTVMQSMFSGAIVFNQDIGSWDVSSVKHMGYMFGKQSNRNVDFGATSFNQDIGNWDVSNVVGMASMFNGASSFNQDLTKWCVTNITSEQKDFSTSSALTEANKPVWGTCPTDSDPIIGTWTLTNEVWVGSGTWPDNQARGCWKSGDEGSPDLYIFTQTLVTKKVWECDQDGKLAVDLVTYGPFSWSNLGNGSYSWGGGTIQVVFENNNTIMKLPFDDGNILQTWTKN